MVHFGTTYADTREKTIEVINAKMKEAFPELEIREAWTSRIILRKLKERGEERLNPTEALIRLQKEGFTHVLVQSTNIIEGTEMTELRREIESLEPNFKDVRVGNPLLYSPEDYATVIQAVTQAMDGMEKGSQKLLVGHGTVVPATASYAMFDYMLKAKGYSHYHVGTVEGYPTFEEALNQLEATKLPVVTLAPLMYAVYVCCRRSCSERYCRRMERETGGKRL